ncbi:ABC transporter permease [Actinoplanes sp. NPDC051411]|uniref:ABC transporter permease n=1 Tax=Actinoplanes sp. NPDC051411 TaxID=3155522 RepID=UPI003448C355
MSKKLASWDSVIILLTVVVLIVASLTVDNFGTGRNFTFLTLDTLPIILVALPMTMIIVTGEIDLSVASTLGLTSSIMGFLWNHGMAIQTIVPLCIVLGAVAGAVNGFLVTGLGLPSLAVTIGTLALYRGLAFVVLGDGAVADFPYNWSSWVTGTFGGGSIPHVLLLIAVLALIFGIVQHATPVGRSLYAIGANAQAAHFSGIRVARTKFWLYVVSGAVCGLVGVLWTLRYSSARADNGSGLELAVVAAVLLGGVSIFGGKGSLPGVLAGVVLLAALQNALRLEDVSGQALNIVTGALLVLSVLLPNIVTAIRGSWQRRKLRQAPRSVNPA